MVPVLGLGDLLVSHLIVLTVGSMAGWFLRGVVSRAIKRALA